MFEGNLTFKDVLIGSQEEFKLDLFNLSLSPRPINIDVENMILKSEPNFNYLYSNYSVSYEEPFNRNPLFANVPKQAINLLYGPKLAVSLEIN